MDCAVMEISGGAAEDRHAGREGVKVVPVLGYAARRGIAAVAARLGGW